MEKGRLDAHALCQTCGATSFKSGQQWRRLHPPLNPEKRYTNTLEGSLPLDDNATSASSAAASWDDDHRAAQCLSSTEAKPGLSKQSLWWEICATTNRVEQPQRKDGAVVISARQQRAAYEVRRQFLAA